jgi:hypothetical protein
MRFRDGESIAAEKGPEEEATISVLSLTEPDFGG